MTRRGELFVLVVAFLVGCRKSGKDWVVLPESEALKLTTPCSRGFPPGLSGYWELKDADIQRAQTRFQEALDQSLRRVAKDELDGSPGQWNAQYAGFFRQGQKVVYVNAIGGGVPDEGWRKHAVKICDGGLMSFGAVLDLQRDAVDSFEFNGTYAGAIRMADPRDAGAAQPGVAPDGASPRR